MLLAYFDPGSASMLMQALVGGGAGLIVFGRYLWASFLGQVPQAPVDSPTPTSAVSTPATLAEALSGEFRFHIT